MMAIGAYALVNRKRIALVDIDNCFVSNETSEYNLKLLDHLQKQQYDEIWLFSGRNGSDSWQHVLKRGKPHPEWKKQLILNILALFEAKGLKVRGVSLPYDHSFKCKPGEGYYNLGLAQLEQEMIRSQDLPQNMSALIQRLTAARDEQMIMDLALAGDFSKEGQLCYLLNSFSDGEYEIDYYDDKTDNLSAVYTKLNDTFPKMSMRCFHVDFTAGAKLTDPEIEATIVEFKKKNRFGF